MRDYQLKMEPFEYVALQDVEIHKGLNCHAQARIVIRVKDDRKEEYLSMLSADTWLKVTAEGETGTSTVLFHGIVTGFTMEQDGYETILHLEAESGTVLMDDKEHFRVFQNKDTPCSLLFDQITAGYAGGKADYPEGADDKTEGVLMQYQETDWAFCKRLASLHNRYIVPDALQKGCGYTVGLPEGVEQSWKAPDIMLTLDACEYQQKVKNGVKGLQMRDMLTLSVTDREIYQLGDFMLYEGGKYYIYDITTRYIGAECVHEYKLRRKEGLQTLTIEHQGTAGCSFEAQVTGVQKDTVQIDITGDEWQALDGKKWFAYATVYSSPDGTGWYSMPEVGDTVRLYVPDHENRCLVVSSVHKETDSARQDPDHKSFKTKYGKEILFTPDSILITNNQGMMVEMNDQEGITMTSDKDILIQAQENMTIASGASSLLIAAEDIVQVKQGGTTMTLSDDIYFTGGEFRIQ